jgi:hypothetical protein
VLMQLTFSLSYSAIDEPHFVPNRKASKKR